MFIKRCDSVFFLSLVEAMLIVIREAFVIVHNQNNETNYFFDKTNFLRIIFLNEKFKKIN
jgi:hypothetical protein